MAGVLLHFFDGGEQAVFLRLLTHCIVTGSSFFHVFLKDKNMHNKATNFLEMPK
jgi:hypothetical protein